MQRFCQYLIFMATWQCRGVNMTILIYIFLFIIGSVFASFIHLYVTRTLSGESIIKPRSHCQNCNHQLKWYELIPVISYIVNHGKCSKCNAKIGIDSLIVEILLGLLFVVVYIRYGISYETLLGFIIACTLVAVSLSDFKEMIILDSTLIVSIIVTYLITFLSLGLRGIYKSFLYGIFAFVLLFVVKVLGDAVFKRESLGGGDIKLSFLMGSILPYNLFLSSMILGSMVALPYALVLTKNSENKELPFGPFLLLGLFIVFLFKNDIMNVVGVSAILERILL